VVLATWAVEPAPEANHELEEVRRLLRGHAAKKQLTDS
jgi:hypothetical protein